MPELPEVETIKKDLSENIIGRKITGVTFLWPGLLKGARVDDFKKKIVGQKIIGVERRAKNLSISLSNNLNMLFHMKMTGHFMLADESQKVDEAGRWVNPKGEFSDPQNQFIRAFFALDNKKILAVSDLRKFAYVKILTDSDLLEAYKEYGPEPFSSEFTEEFLKKLLASKKTAIKKVLMDQKNIAGIGNIYADEILWEIKVHPETKANDIPDNKVKELYSAIKKILTQAIEFRGTSTSDFRDTSGKKGRYGDIRKVYRRTGLPCPRDKTPIERIVIGGRGTHFCPTCQKLS